MMSYLTSPDPEFDRRARRTPKGMMYWAGTCSDPAATCGGCRHYGYMSVIRNASGNAIRTIAHATGCGLYHKYTGRHGAEVKRTTPACKYFEPRPEPAEQSEHLVQPVEPADCGRSEASSADRRTEMDLSQYATSQFIKVEDLADGPQRKTITNVEPGKFDKPVVTFADRTRLTLNGTNVNTIINAFGSTESDELIGKDVELYVGTIRYQGDDKESVLIRALSRPAPTKTLQAELDDEIPF